LVALIQLLAFAGLLMPGFLQMVAFYFLSARVHRSVRYGSEPRNCLDVYVPRLRWLTQKGPRPVVVYVTGGAWVIGYKAWGALVGRRLSQRGVLVFCLDYRNFPQGTALDMLEDVNRGISWVLERCQYFGGDPERVHLVSQSAGAQIAGLALIKQAMKSCGRKVRHGASPPWDPLQIKGFVGVSGAYDLQELQKHLHGRGMYESLFRDIFTLDGRVAYKDLSPSYAVLELTSEEWRVLPPMLLLHGTHDRTVPPHIAQKFFRALKVSPGAIVLLSPGTLLESSATLNIYSQETLTANIVDQKSGGRLVELKLLEGKTHTSPIVEDPLCGKDTMLDEILSSIQGEEVRCFAFPMVPRFLARIAGSLSPF